MGMEQLEGKSSVPERAGWNGTEERPEWGASPEKPSKPLRFGTRSMVLASWHAYGVSCLFLRIRSYLSGILCALAENFARPARALNIVVRTKRVDCARNEIAQWNKIKKRDDCADVFATSKDGTRRDSEQDEIPGVDGLPRETRSLHPRVYADAEKAELGFAQGGAGAADQRD